VDKSEHDNDHLGDHIKIDVATQYIESESDPEQDRYVFAYRISIQNNGSEPAQLLSRHWIIRDANGKTQEVHGEGVVGDQPHIKPGNRYEYTSGTMLETSMGTMGGTYLMVTDDGREFKAPIDEFLLSTPHTLH